jgi:hypothetical protein
VPSVSFFSSSTVKETPDLRKIAVPLNEAPAVLAESPSAQKDPSAITIEHAPAISIESPPSKQSVAVFTEYHPPLKQSIAVFKESPLEDTTPKEAVMLSDR